MHQDNKVRNPHDPHDPETKEAKDRETIQLIQSRCVHRRRGVTSDEGHNVVKCLDCGKFLYGLDI